MADDFFLSFFYSKSVEKRMEIDQNYCIYTRTSCPTIAACLCFACCPNRAAARGKFAFVPYGLSFVPGREIDGFLYFCLKKYKILSCHLSAKNAERFEGKKEDVESPKRAHLSPGKAGSLFRQGCVVQESFQIGF